MLHDTDPLKKCFPQFLPCHCVRCYHTLSVFTFFSKSLSSPQISLLLFYTMHLPHYIEGYFPRSLYDIHPLKKPSVSLVRRSEIEIPLLVTSGASQLSSKPRPGSLLHLSSQTPQVSAALGFPVFLEGALLPLSGAWRGYSLFGRLHSHSLLGKVLFALEAQSSHVTPAV